MSVESLLRTCLDLFSYVVVEPSWQSFQYFSAMEFRRAGSLWFATGASSGKDEGVGTCFSARFRQNI